MGYGRRAIEADLFWILGSIRTVFIRAFFGGGEVRVLSSFLGVVWALRAPLRVVLWGIPYRHGFLPPFSRSLESVFLLWHVPSALGGLLAHF